MAGPLEMPYKEAVAVLARLDFDRWLEVHGKLNRKVLSKKQEMELKECFQLLDAQATKSISANDMPLAFETLNMDVSKEEIDEAVRQVCDEKQTMGEYRFKCVVMLYFDRLPKEDYPPSDSGKRLASAKYKLPFAFKAPAYRRKKLREAVVSGDRNLYRRMKARSIRAFTKRAVLRQSGTTEDKKPKGKGSMTAQPSEEKKRALRKTREKESKAHLPEYNLIPREVIQNVLATGVKYVPATNRSVETDRLFSGPGGEILSKACLKEELNRFRADLQHKPTLKKQVIRLQAVKAWQDFYQNRPMQVKGSPLLQLATRRIF